jgi:hypothetical protein
MNNSPATTHSEDLFARTGDTKSSVLYYFHLCTERIPTPVYDVEAYSFTEALRALVALYPSGVTTEMYELNCTVRVHVEFVIMVQGVPFRYHQVYLVREAKPFRYAPRTLRWNTGCWDNLHYPAVKVTDDSKPLPHLSRDLLQLGHAHFSGLATEPCTYFPFATREGVHATPSLFWCCVWTGLPLAGRVGPGYSYNGSQRVYHFASTLIDDPDYDFYSTNICLEPHTGRFFLRAQSFLAWGRTDGVLTRVAYVEVRPRRAGVQTMAGFLSNGGDHLDAIGAEIEEYRYNEPAVGTAHPRLILLAHVDFFVSHSRDLAYEFRYPRWGIGPVEGDGTRQFILDGNEIVPATAEQLAPGGYVDVTGLADLGYFVAPDDDDDPALDDWANGWDD